MKKIPLKSRILNIGHNDFDAAVCNIILANVYKNIKFINTNFAKIDSILEYIDYRDYDWVFLTDIHPEKPSNLYISDKIILLDHHESGISSHNPSKHHFVIPKMCAAKITYNFIKTMYPEIDISHLKNLVMYANDYDLYTLKLKKSKLLNDLMFFKYRVVNFRKEFIDGRTNFTDEEIAWLKDRDKLFKQRWKELEVFDIDNLPICVVNANYFLNEIAHKLMEEEGYDIVFVRNPDNERISVRTKRDDIHLGNILKKMKMGGGHAKASGMIISNIHDFENKLKKVVKVIKEDYYK